jgi:hypothetical protein
MEWDERAGSFFRQKLMYISFIIIHRSYQNLVVSFTCT